MNRRDFLHTATALTAAALAPPDGVWAANASGQPETGETRGVARFGDGRDWFLHKRFGMFVHWGIYALEGWHEQHQWRARVPRSEYVKLAARWNPVKFDPEAWLDLMQEAGMQHLCITAKHHDGFCLWDTRQTGFNVMNTPYKRDILGLLSQACRKRGVPLRFYYSVVDWNHPNYPNQGRSHELPPQSGDRPDLDAYLEFLTAQIRELCTQYGEIHGIWWDMNVTGRKDASINTLIRQLQPKAVINGRGFDPGDFGTPERDYEKDETVGFTRLVEACQSVGMESWGYRKDEDYYTDRHLIRSIDRYLSRDANYLLNVGPKPDGTIAAEDSGVLRRIGQWLRAVRESFEGVTPASTLTSNRNVMLTRRDRTLYVHLNKDPQGDGVKLKPIAVAPRRATLLNTGDAVPFSLQLTPADHQKPQRCLRLLKLPVNQLANTVLVVKLEFDRPIEDLALPATNVERISDEQK